MSQQFYNEITLIFNRMAKMFCLIVVSSYQHIVKLLFLLANLCSLGLRGFCTLKYPNSIFLISRYFYNLNFKYVDIHS